MKRDISIASKGGGKKNLRENLRSVFRNNCAQF